MPTLIFLLQYLELLADIESLISILSSVAPERRLRFDVIFCANDGRRLLASLLHSFKIVLESWSTWLFRVSSSFSANGDDKKKKKPKQRKQSSSRQLYWVEMDTIYRTMCIIYIWKWCGVRCQVVHNSVRVKRRKNTKAKQYEPTRSCTFYPLR